MVSIVAAIDEKRGLGKNNDLLFHIPEDMKHFKDLTLGHPVIMGRKTWDSIPENRKPLPNRRNIVVTRDSTQVEKGSIGPEFAESLENAIELAKTGPGSEEICIVGGGQIFKEAIERDLVNVLHLTIVKGDYGADVFFPEYEEKFKKVLGRQEGRSGEYEYTFLDLSRG